MEDWQVFVTGPRRWRWTHVSAAAIREAIAAEMTGRPETPIRVGGFRRWSRHWLQASNHSERLKWDALFRDAPPLKFGKTDAPGT
jgi:hypothetical protein